MKIMQTKSEIRAKREAKAYYKQLNKNRKKPKQTPKHKCPESLKNKPYIEFLNSNYWLKIRKRALARDGHKCIICGSADNLHIHHNTYKHHFSEHRHLEDLMTLCAHCHEIHHQSQD